MALGCFRRPTGQQRAIREIRSAIEIHLPAGVSQVQLQFVFPRPSIGTRSTAIICIKAQAPERLRIRNVLNGAECSGVLCRALRRCPGQIRASVVGPCF